MHKGKIVAEKEKYKVIDCEICGFKHLNPLPSSKELLEFYRKKYSNLVKKGGRAPEIRRQMAGGEEAKSELEWLSSTLYSEIRYVLGKYIHKKSKHLLDIGSGTGEFLRYIMNAGWDAIGIEPSEEYVQVTANSDLTIYNMSLEKFITTHPDYKHKFDAITLLNVLEHVPNPAKFLQYSKKLLKAHTGVLCIRVPNDFTELQFYAEKKLNKTLWWVAIPDHLNYFNIESLQKLIESIGFEVLYTTADFPMELFLLMGDDYIENPEVGSLCHRKRVNFELSIASNLRQKIYQSLVKIGIGRDSMVFAKIN